MCMFAIFPGLCDDATTSYNIEEKGMWSRAVWLEGDMEEESVVPAVWIKGGRLYWPPGADARKALQECRVPSTSWRSFHLVKVKITSKNRSECEEFELTTTVESSEEEEDEVVSMKRKKKKKLFDDFETGEIKDGLPSPPSKFQVNSRPSMSPERRRSPRKAAVLQSPETIHSLKRSHNSRGLPSTRSPPLSPVTSLLRTSRSRSPVSSPKRSVSPTFHRSNSKVSTPKRQYSAKRKSQSSLPNPPKRLFFNSQRTRSSSRSRSPVQFFNSQRTRSPSRSRSPVQFYHRPPSTSGEIVSIRSNSPVNVSLNELCSTLSNRRRTPSHSRSPVNPKRSGSTRSKSPVHPHRSGSTRSKSPVHPHRSGSTRSKSPIHPNRSGSTRSKSPVLEQSRRHSPPRPSTSTVDTGYPMTEARFQKRVIYLLCEIRNLLSKGPAPQAADVINEEMAPAETLEDFKQLEDSLKSADTKLKMIQTLSSVGGVSLRDNTKRVMHRVMSIRLMAEFNMLGNVKGNGEQKLAFKITALYSVVKGCVTKNFSGTEQEFDKCMSSLLKYAPDRKGGVGRKRD